MDNRRREKMASWRGANVLTAVDVASSVVVLLGLISWSSASPLPQPVNNGVAGYPPLLASPSRLSWPYPTSTLVPTSNVAAASPPVGNSSVVDVVDDESGNIEQVGRLQFTSSWELGQFNLPFSVQAEEISDDEWRQMMTDDLRRHGVLGQIVDTVPPYVVNVEYSEDACVHMGNDLAPRQTQLQPYQVNFPKNDSSGGLFTLMAIDPDVPSQNNSIYSEFLHWLVVNIPNEDIERGDVLAEYLGPLPSHKGGQHRFIFLAHRQPDGAIIDTAALPHAESCDWASRARFSARKFAQLHRLGQPLAINYFNTRFDSTVPQVIERCLLRRQTLIHIQQRLSYPVPSAAKPGSVHSILTSTSSSKS